MKPIEEELKDSLRRVEPSAGFAERVMARARLETRSKPTFAQRFREWFRPKPVRWAAAMGFVCLVIVVGVLQYQEAQNRRLQGERASEQARIALQIASAKLNAVFKDAERSSRHNLEN